MQIELTEAERDALVDYISDFLLHNIRLDDCWDGIDYLCNLCSAYKKIEAANE